MKRKKRIAVIGVKGLPGFGGAARAMESLIDYLKEEYEFTVYSIESHTSMRGWFNGYRQIVFRSNRNKLLNTFFYYWKSLFHCLLRGNYDLVHINHGPSGYIVPFLKLRYPVVMTLRGVYDEERYDEKFSKVLNRTFKVFQTVAFKFADVLVSVSKHEMAFVRRHSRKPVLHIPNGVNAMEAFPERAIPFEDYILFAAARIYGIKGCDIFLRALGEIQYSGKVLIIGDLSQDSGHRELIQELAIGLDIGFIGLIKEKFLLMAYLREAKLFVFPSRMEGMSNMLLEAVSIGCPVICSDIPANTGVFSEDEVTFFRSGDHLELGKKISMAFEDYDLMKEKARLGRSKIETEYSWEHIGQQYSGVYERLLSNDDLSTSNIPKG